MLRLNELKLPLNHADDELPAAILARLGITADQMTSFTVFKRSYDARKKAAIVLIYTVDCELRDEAAVLARLAGQPHIRPAPDTTYRFIGHAPAGGLPGHRPVVIGFGPCYSCAPSEWLSVLPIEQIVVAHKVDDQRQELALSTWIAQRRVSDWHLESRVFQ